MGTALITGASAGIGRCLAIEFARHGHDVVLTARDEARLTALATALAQRYGVEATVLAGDLAESATSARLVDELATRGLAIDYLANNAGFGARGAFQTMPLADQLAMLQVNVVSLTCLTRLLLPGMLERGRGGVLNVASTAAFMPGPLMAVYYASKAYVLSLSEALHEELRGTGVTVTALCPGATRTGFQARAGVPDLRQVSSLVAMDAAPVARAGYRGLQRGQAVVVPGAFNRGATLLPRLMPREWMARLVRPFNAFERH